MRHIISVLLENEPGALSRVVGLFSQRNYNIDSLTVAPTEDQSLSRLTVMTSGDDARIEQITKHLNKLVDVVKLVDLTEGAHIERELMLIKVKASGAQRAEIARTVDIFRGQIVDLTATVFTIQITGAGKSWTRLLQPWARVWCWRLRAPGFQVSHAATRPWRSNPKMPSVGRWVRYGKSVNGRLFDEPPGFTACSRVWLA